jgi:lipopolysaccharide transport system ATP-binding protein
MGDIHVHNIGKAYKVYPGQWSRLVEWIAPFSGQRHQLTWVLKDVSFEVRAGEAVGIIGINGAGKSTLLKIIVGTILATCGQVVLDGRRVAALLELGMGFHPDFTGRQNAFMSAQLLGLDNETIHSLMPEIEAFAEIGDYIDQPLRVYSSGMQMRLAFSVATAVRPDILIVDEALSVGDSYFQHKSFDRIRQFGRQGTTLLFVSHDKGAIQSLCDRAILLNKGVLAMEGEPEAVMNYYNALIAEQGGSRIQRHVHEEGRPCTRSGTGEASFLDIRLVDDQGRCLETIAVGQYVTLCLRFSTEVFLPEIVLGYQIKDRLGQVVYGTNTAYLDKVQYDLDAGETMEYRFRFQANLGEGSYSVSVALHTSESHVTRNYEWHDIALVFTVVNQRHDRFIGVNWLPPTVECSR